MSGIFLPLALLALLASLLPCPLAQEDDPRPVLIQSDESWQNGVVLIYSTAVLVALRLSSTVRHSPLSPIANIPRIYYYAAASLVVGLVSTLTLLLLSIFSATRDVSRDLMPCASPLLALGGLLALLPQFRAPQMDAQPIATVMGMPHWLAILATALLNGMTIAASAINGAWAATSISLATSLIAIFGPRTPVVANTVANGIVEPGGPLIFRVAQRTPEKILTLSLTAADSTVRELVGPGWAKLPTDADLSHDGRLKIGARPVVRAVVVNEEDVPVPLLSESGHNMVQLISGDNSEVVGYLPLAEWVKNPFGEDVIRVRVTFTDFFSMILGRTIWASCMTEAEYGFPGAYEANGNIVRRLLSSVAPPDYDALGLRAGVIDLSSEINTQLDEYEGKLILIDRVTADMEQPHRNIMRIVLMTVCSHIYEVHDEDILRLAFDSLAQVLQSICRSDDDDDLIMDISELCVIVEGFSEVVSRPDSELDEEDTKLYALVTSMETRSVRWIYQNERSVLQEHLTRKTHALILSESFSSVLANRESNANALPQVIAMSISSTGTGALRVQRSAIAEQKSRKWTTPERVLTETEWNESRRRNPQRVWPANWQRDTPETASIVATVKGLSEIASLQAITSGIAAGSVLFGRLLGA